MEPWQGHMKVSNIGGARQLQSLNIGGARGGAKYYNPQILRVLEPLSPLVVPTPLNRMD